MTDLRNLTKKLILHAMAVYLGMLSGVMLTGLIILIIPGAGKTSTLLGRMVDAPYWLPELVCGLIWGWIVRHRYASSSCSYGIVLPALFLLTDILLEGLRLRRWTPLVDVYFSGSVGATEGLYELMYTVPVYVAGAYALGGAVAKLSQRAWPTGATH